MRGENATEVYCILGQRLCMVLSSGLASLGVGVPYSELEKIVYDDLKAITKEFPGLVMPDGTEYRKGN